MSFHGDCNESILIIQKQLFIIFFIMLAFGGSRNTEAFRSAAKVFARMERCDWVAREEVLWGFYSGPI